MNARAGDRAGGHAYDTSERPREVRTVTCHLLYGGVHAVPLTVLLIPVMRYGEHGVLSSVVRHAVSNT